MCQPKPGPRCASHTKAELAAAQQAVTDAVASGAAPFEVMNLRSAVSAAQSAFDATPTGQQEILDEIAALAPGASSYALRGRYEAAVRTRTEQEAAQAAVERVAAADREVASRLGTSRLAPPPEQMRIAAAQSGAPLYFRKAATRAPVRPEGGLSDVYDFATVHAHGDVVKFDDGTWQAFAVGRDGGWVTGPEKRSRVAAVRAAEEA